MSVSLPLRPAKANSKPAFDASTETEEGFVVVTTEKEDVKDPAGQRVDTPLKTEIGDTQEHIRAIADLLEKQRMYCLQLHALAQLEPSNSPNFHGYPSIPVFQSPFILDRLPLPPKTDDAYEGPPFETQKTLFPLFVGRKRISANLNAMINKGFFKSENKWTSYRTSCFSISVSYSLDQWEPGMQVDLQVGNKLLPIQGFAVSLSASQDSDKRRPVGIYQTPKGDRGPKLTIPQMIIGPNQAGITPNAQGPSPPRHRNDKFTFDHLHVDISDDTYTSDPQHFCLVAELWAKVQAPGAVSPEWKKIAIRDSTPLAVRGRTPMHFTGPLTVMRTVGDAATSTRDDDEVVWHLREGRFE